MVGGIADAQAPSPGLCPQDWARSLIYYQSFKSSDGSPEVNTAGLQVYKHVSVGECGFLQKCGLPQKDDILSPNVWGERIQASDATLSPSQPLTISFWWALPFDPGSNASFDLLYLGGNSGYIGNIYRGGPWGNLADTAAVGQVYNLPGIANVSVAYDLHARENGGLKAGVWHHEALVISGASLVTIYSDGTQVFQTRTTDTGREFKLSDGFMRIDLGGGLCLQEIAILKCALSAAEINEYVGSIRALAQMKQ